MRSSVLAAVAVATAPTAMAAKLIVSHFTGPVFTLDFQQTSADEGSLTVSSQIDNSCGKVPGWVHVDKEKDTVYCFDESWNDNLPDGTGKGVIAQYSADANAKLTVTGSGTTTGNSAHGGIYGGPEGRSFAATTEYTPGTMNTYKLPITNSTTRLQFLQFEGTGPHPRQGNAHPHEARADPTGDYLVVPDLGSDRVRVLRINHETGFLAQCSEAKSNPGDGPRHGLFHTTKEGQQVYYALNELGSSMGVYNVSYPAKGDGDAAGCLQLNLKQTILNFPEGRKPDVLNEKAAELRIAGEFLYASNRNDKTFGPEQDSLAIFKIGCGGVLRFITLTNAYGFFPRFFDINKAEDLVAIGGQTTASVAVVKRDAKTGLLGKLVARIVLPPVGTYQGEDGISSVAWWD